VLARKNLLKVKKNLKSKVIKMGKEKQIMYLNTFASIKEEEHLFLLKVELEYIYIYIYIYIYKTLLRYLNSVSLDFSTWHNHNKIQ
jgi:hypothetical protein